jgi:hypothetical protein
MAKAYRTDLVGEKRIADAIAELGDVEGPERFSCPVDGCACSYEVYEYVLSDTTSNRETLQDKLRREHPNHPEEIFVLNEPQSKKTTREDVNQAAARIVKEATEKS